MKYQTELDPSAAMKQFEAGEGLHSERVDFSDCVRKPPVLLDDDAVRRFIAHGFVKIPSSLPGELHERICQKIHQAIGNGRADLNPGNNLLPLIPELQLVYSDPGVRGALISLLGPDYMMHPHRYAHDNPSGSGEQAWHHDSYWGYVRKVRDHRPWCILAMYFPQETSKAMGPTGVLPGSQYTMKRNETAAEAELPASGEAGSCLLVHYDIWHRKMENLTELSRYMTKFEFLRMRAPAGPSWNAGSLAWGSPETPAAGSFEPVWRSVWEWMGGKSTAASPRSPAELVEAALDPDEVVAINACFELALTGDAGVAALGKLMLEHDGANTADPRLFFDEGQEAEIGYVVRNAAYALVSAGDAAAPTLLRVLDEGDELGRKYATYALGQIESNDQAVVSALVRASRDDNADVRISAVEALGLKGASGTNALIQALEDFDDEVRFTATLALARIGPGAASAIPALQPALSDGNRYVRGYAVEALERIGTPEAIEVLLPFLKTSRWCDLTTPESCF